MRRHPKTDSHFVIYSDAFLDVIGCDPGYETIPNINAHEATLAETGA